MIVKSILDELSAHTDDTEAIARFLVETFNTEIIARAMELIIAEETLRNNREVLGSEEGV